MIEGKAWTPTPDPQEPITEESAMRIGRDCQHCQEPECQNACPADIETSLFARRIESGNFVGAAKVLREVNPLSEICGYICPAERYCEKECSRLDFSDRPVRIRELHGWVCGHVSKYDGWERAVAPQNGNKVAVVGAGPAGLTCAHYLARLGYQVDIMDKGKGAGGMLNHAVPDFRLPDEIVAREIEGLTLPGMAFQYGRALGKDFTVADLEAEYNAVFLAPGLWAGRTLDIAGLEKSKTTDGLSFLQACRGNGKGKVGKNVIVIGGGSVASDAAVSAKRCGAKAVTLVCLEGAEEMPCLQSELLEMKEQGIKIENGWGPKGAASKTELSFVRCKSVFDKSGAFRPVFEESNTMELRFDQVILAVGQRTEPALAKYLKKEFGKEEGLDVDQETMQVVGRSGVFAGGDIVRGAGTVVEAVGDGRRAAAAIDELVKDDPGI
jgi:NADPH-dependent glutamate synthase beta subunit-like oxidoreductase